MTDPVIKTIDVPCAQNTAFDIFTKDLGAWWPRDKHSVSAMTGKTAQSVTLDLREGGDLVEIGHDGARHHWGSITVYDPHDQLSLLWHINTPKSKATKVDITFVANGSGTRVTLKHHGWEVLGDDAQGQRDGYNGGWVFVFETKFAEACRKVDA